MELGNSEAEGCYQNLQNGIDFPFSAYEVRLMDLIVHTASIYILSVAENIEYQCCRSKEEPILESPPF
jgi:hypothetical protein